MPHSTHPDDIERGCRFGPECLCLYDCQLEQELRDLPVWLVEGRWEDGEWETVAEFVDEVEAYAYLGLTAADRGHSYTLVRVRDRDRTEPAVTVSSTVVRHVLGLLGAS